MREDVDDKFVKRKSARISRNKTNAGAFATSVPASPIAESVEDFSSVRTPSYMRHGSLGNQVITDEERQQLASILNNSQKSNNRDRMDNEEKSGSCTSIEEESGQTLPSKEEKRKKLWMMPDVEDVEENERTLTSREGKMLAEEFKAYSRHNSDSLNDPVQDPKRDSRA